MRDLRRKRDLLLRSRPGSTRSGPSASSGSTPPAICASSSIKRAPRVAAAAGRSASEAPRAANFATQLLRTAGSCSRMCRSGVSSSASRPPQTARSLPSCTAMAPPARHTGPATTWNQSCTSATTKAFTGRKTTLPPGKWFVHAIDDDGTVTLSRSEPLDGADTAPGAPSDDFGPVEYVQFPGLVTVDPPEPRGSDLGSGWSIGADNDPSAG